MGVSSASGSQRSVPTLGGPHEDFDREAPTTKSCWARCQSCDKAKIKHAFPHQREGAHASLFAERLLGGHE